MGADDKKKVDDKKKDEKPKVEVKTATYKVFVHCGQCARDIQTQFTEFPGACGVVCCCSSITSSFFMIMLRSISEYIYVDRLQGLRR